MKNAKRVEEIFRETGVLMDGHFLLTSGRHSNQYMQCAKIMQYPKYTTEIVEMLVDSHKDKEIDYVVSPAVGGIIIGYELARQLEVKNLFAERVDGEMTIRRGFTLPKGSKVLIGEDVITTGGSIKEVIKLVEDCGSEVVGIAVLVDRSNNSVDFGADLQTALTVEVKSWEEENCPICKEAKEKLISPGSRNLNK